MFKKTLIAAALSVAATGSFAQVYVQGALGSGTVNLGASGATVTKSSTGNKLAVGYELGNGWAVEGMLASFGKAVATSGSKTADAKASSTAIGAVYSGEFSAGHGFKAGLYYGMNKMDVSGSLVTTPSAKTNGSINFGLGYSYSFNKTTALTVDYDTASFKNDNITGTTGASLLSVGVRFKF